jgi:two-component system, sensor histidine kinase and response regulator
VEKVSDETRTLRRTMRDLVALSALPAVWAGYQPRQVPEGLADVLLSTLRLDLVYLRLPGQTEGQEIEVARTAGRPVTPDQTRDLGRALAPWLDGGSADSAPSFLNPAGGETVRLVIVRIGGDREDGVLVAGSQQTGFPSEADRLLLTVGANQAAAVLQRQRAEEALRESEERFRNLLLGLPAAVYTTDRQGRITLFNDQAAELWGRRPDIGKDMWCGSWRIFQPDGTPVPHDQSSMAVALDGGYGRLRQEFIIERPDGTRVWVLAHPRPLRDASGELVGAVNMLVDITESKQAEEAIRASNDRFRIVTKATNDAVWDWDLNTNKVWWNEGALTLFGYRLETNEADPGWWLERIHPEDRAAVEAHFFEVVRGKELSWVDEYRFRCADGSYKDVYDRGYVLRDPEGRAVRMIGAMLDITARKRAEEALRVSRERLDLVVQSTELGLWYCDLPFDKLAWNAKCKDHFGLPPDADVTIGLFYERLHPEDRERTRQAVESAIGQHSTYDVKFRTVAPDGGVRWIRAIGRAFYDRAGKPIRFDGVQVDDTRQKQAEEELQQAKEAAEAANRAKDEFLANVSHEIRTPMNAILGMTELALDTPLTEDQRLSLKTVKAAADNLLGIINDLLDFSKIEAGKLELEPADFSLRATLGDTVRTLAMRAHKKGLELVSHVQPDVPDALVGDAGRLRQVLLNLVGNAIKFTEAGEVIVRLEVAGDPGLEEVGVRFVVSDTGIGIPRDKQEKVFRAFEQQDTSTTRKYGGTGLGLSIAARLVALMGGTITVQSEPGRGSTFAFTAQFGRQPHPTEKPPALPPVLLRDLRVLVVDDNATNRHILEERLRGWQMDPAAVGDGVAAMGALWDAASVGRPYPLVLLDARMPDTDGLALAAWMRERAALSAIRIILLTSGDRPGDLARSRELRIDAHLLKPVQQDELLETIYRVMSRAQGDAPTAVEEPARELTPVSVPPAAPLNILVAEDSEFSAQLMEQLLARRGHRLRLATNGREALALAKEGDFDVLLLDVHMPELDGFEVVQAIRKREQTVGGHLPVIALTARSRKEDRERCLAAGMDDFLTKPIRPADLLAAIDRLAPAPGVSRPVPPAAGEPVRLLDPVAVLTACGDDEEALQGMCRAFQTYLPDRLAEVGDALRAQDAPRLREAAHKLCGLLSAFSTTAGDVALDLEELAAGDRLAEARPLVERLEAMAQELLPLVVGLSLETLRQQRDDIEDHQPAGQPPSQPAGDS